MHVHTRTAETGTGVTAAWIGVDPGARWTGIVARRGSELLAWAIVDRHEVDPGSEVVTDAYLDAVDHTLAHIQDQAGAQCSLACESVVEPNAHLGMVRVAHILGTAEVARWLQGRHPGLVMVRPGGHGSRPLVTYPAELVTHMERRSALARAAMNRPAGQSNVIRHARSAWDVAGAGPAAERMAAAVRSARER